MTIELNNPANGLGLSDATIALITQTNADNTPKLDAQGFTFARKWGAQANSTPQTVVLGSAGVVDYSYSYSDTGSTNSLATSGDGKFGLTPHTGVQTPLNSNEQAAVVYAIDAWEAVANITFNYTSSLSDGYGIFLAKSNFNSWLFGRFSG